jgi:hypothetical protein
MPWLIGRLEWLIVIVLLMGARYYFIVVTDRRVLFMKASPTWRPKGLAWADPRGAVQIHDVDLDRWVWSKFRYRRSDGKDIRINIFRSWREDGRAVVGALAGQPQVPPQ